MRRLEYAHFVHVFRFSLVRISVLVVSSSPPKADPLLAGADFIQQRIHQLVAGGSSIPQWGLKTKGQGIHRICFEVEDVEAEVKAYLDKGATMIDQKPRPGAHNTKVAFIHPKSSSGVLIELCELPKGH